MGLRDNPARRGEAFYGKVWVGGTEDHLIFFVNTFNKVHAAELGHMDIEEDQSSLIVEQSEGPVVDCPRPPQLQRTSLPDIVSQDIDGMLFVVDHDTIDHSWYIKGTVNSVLK